MINLMKIFFREQGPLWLEAAKKLTHWQVSSLGPFHLPGYKLLFTHRVKVINVTYFLPPRRNEYRSQHVEKRRWIFGDEKLKKLALSDGIMLWPEKLSRLDIFKIWNTFTTQSIISLSYITPHQDNIEANWFFLWTSSSNLCSIYITLLFA